MREFELQNDCMCLDDNTHKFYTCGYMHICTCACTVHAPAILSVVEPVEPVGSGIECSSDSDHVHVDLE